MSLPRHDPPGFVKDIKTDENKQAWSDLISSFMNTTWVNPTLTPQFYDATKVKEKEPTQNHPITWNAFPKKIKTESGGNNELRWRTADASRDNQDEYCEWSVQRNNDGKITKIVFCNEGPEYFKFLADTDPGTLLDLYKSLNPNAVGIESSDLYDPTGKYNPRNKWNDNTDTGNIMHLIQPVNTLWDQCDLGGLATILRVRGDGTRITDPVELTNCTGFGDNSRNSDPTIGSAVNNLAWGGSMITIRNPVALYLYSVDLKQVTHPKDDDFNPAEIWTWVRGEKGTYMRAVCEAPEGSNYILGDLLVNENPLEYGSQIADLIQVSLTGRTMDTGGSNQITPRTCGEAPGHRPDRPPAP